MKKIFLLFILVTGIFLHPYVASGIEGRTMAGKISSGYDDNVSEEAVSKTGRTFINVYLDSKFPLHRSKRLGGAFRLQNGFKIIGNDENVALSQVNLKCAFFVSPRITSEIINELKYKYISTSPNNLIQGEYGYLYWHSGFSIHFREKDFSSTIKYLHRQRDYKDVDFSDSKTHQIQCETKVPFSRTLTGRFAGKIESFRFSWQEETLWQEEIVQKRRDDILYELSIGIQWIDGILINPGYTFRKNKSKDGDEYSYYAHQLSILTAMPLWGEITMQIYGCLQMCEYDSQKITITDPVDEDNTDQLRNLLIFNLSRDVLKNCSLEARYLLSQGDLSSSSKKYKKQSYSLGLCYSF